MSRALKVAIGVSIPTDLRDRLDRAADADSRSRSWMICEAIREYLDRLDASTDTTTGEKPAS